MMIILIVFIAAGFIGAGMYNSLIFKKNQVGNAFAGVDVMLKKRYDLIPGLVSTVQAYMQYEKDLLTEVTSLRARAVSGQVSEEEKTEIDNKMTRAIRGIMVAVENYPDLKANGNFLHLQASLNEIEEQISVSRRAFNVSVVDYNNAVEMFPSSLVAGMMGYKPRKVFETADAEREKPDVKQLFNK
jgi:LemA protein